MHHSRISSVTFHQIRVFCSADACLQLLSKVWHQQQCMQRDTMRFGRAAMASAQRARWGSSHSSHLSLPLISASATVSASRCIAVAEMTLSFANCHLHNSIELHAWRLFAQPVPFLCRVHAWALLKRSFVCMGLTSCIKRCDCIVCHTKHASQIC